jgi:hypothetical protein
MIPEYVDVRYWVLELTLTIGLVSLVAFSNTRVKLVRFVRPGFRKHSMNGAVSCAVSDQLMPHNDLHLVRCW